MNDNDEFKFNNVSTHETIHMNCQILVSLKSKNKKQQQYFQSIVCYKCERCLKG